MKILTVLALFAAAAIATLGYLRQRSAGRDRSGLAALEAQDARLRDDLAVRQGELDAALARKSRAGRLLAARRGAPEAKPKIPAGMSRFYELLRSDPRLQNLQLASKRAQYRRTYGALLRRLGLAPEAEDKFLAAMAARDERMMDLQSTAQSQGLSRNDPAIAALARQSASDWQSQMQDALGADGWQQFQEYNRSLPVRTLVDQLAGAVAFSAPLSPDQAEALTQAMVEGSSHYGKGGAADWQSQDWAAIDQKAQAILTPEQMAVWQQTEPMGGGPSRWMAQLQAALHDAGRAGG